MNSKRILAGVAVVALLMVTLPAIASDGGSVMLSSTSPVTTTVDQNPVVDENEDFGIPTSSLGAAVASADGGIAGWVWLVLAGLILIGVGVWALRQPV